MGAGMHRNFPAYQDDEGFRRIAVLLLNLALLAEMAALRSWPVRCLMLWLLRPAEEAGRGFATDCGYVEASPLLADGPETFSNDGVDLFPGDGLDEAARLAWIFRALAAFFFDLSYEAAQLIYGAGRQAPGCMIAGRSKATRLYLLLAASPPRYVDTS